MNDRTPAKPGKVDIENWLRALGGEEWTHRVSVDREWLLELLWRYNGML